MRWILPGAGLGAVFLLMIGSIKPADWIIALFVGALGALAASAALRGRRRPPGRMSLAGAPRFAAGVVIQLVTGTARTLRTLLRPGPGLTGQIVAVPLTGRSEAARALDALVTSASPGTMVVIVDRDRDRSLVHAIEVASPEQIRRDINRFYQRYQKSFLP